MISQQQGEGWGCNDFDELLPESEASDELVIGPKRIQNEKRKT